jgi:hypothetical protein
VVEHCKITISKHQISGCQGLRFQVSGFRCHETTKMGVPARLALLAWRAGHRVDDCGMRIADLRLHKTEKDKAHG